MIPTLWRLTKNAGHTTLDGSFMLGQAARILPNLSDQFVPLALRSAILADLKP
jgi:hypothetical protein